MKTKRQNEALKEIKEIIETESFKIKERRYAPLHTTSYPIEILKKLQDDEFLAHRGTLGNVLRENGLTYEHYKKNHGGINAYHRGITCFEILKKIV